MSRAKEIILKLREGFLPPEQQELFDSAIEKIVKYLKDNNKLNDGDIESIRRDMSDPQNGPVFNHTEYLLHFSGIQLDRVDGLMRTVGMTQEEASLFVNLV